MATATELTTEATDDHETLTEIIRLNDEVAEARAKWETAHRKAKAAKEVFEERQDALNAYIAHLGESYPLFDKPAKEEAQEPDDDAWRTVELSTLDIPAAALKALAENDPPVTTLGALADWSNAGNQLADVKGIGRAKAEKIENAVEIFWSLQKARQETTGDAEAEPAEEAKGGAA